jgi:hypothetical protein
MALSPTDRARVLRPTGIVLAGDVGARTGIGTYINYLLGATVLAATAIGASLARGKARSDRSDAEPRAAERPERATGDEHR